MTRKPPSLGQILVRIGAALSCLYFAWASFQASLNHGNDPVYGMFALVFVILAGLVARRWSDWD